MNFFFILFIYISLTIIFNIITKKKKKYYVKILAFILYLKILNLFICNFFNIFYFFQDNV